MRREVEVHRKVEGGAPCGVEVWVSAFSDQYVRGEAAMRMWLPRTLTQLLGLSALDAVVGCTVLVQQKKQSHV